MPLCQGERGCRPGEHKPRQSTRWTESGERARPGTGASKREREDRQRSSERKSYPQTHRGRVREEKLDRVRERPKGHMK